MRKDWLWDRKISIAKVKDILKDPDNPRFVEFVALLLSRKNTPKEVFDVYIEPLVFCRNWHKIKRQMRKDKWNNPRIEFWQQVYGVLLDKYKKEGVVIKEAKKGRIDSLCKHIGNEIRKIRKQKGLSQVKLAKKIGISQQIISRIERGDENISIATLKRITDALEVKVNLQLV
jgi:DNA-binding XRE family transcriptional regulator